MLRLRFARLLISEWVQSVLYRWSLYRTSVTTGATFESGVEIRSLDRLRVGSGTIIASGTLLHCGGYDWCDKGGGISIGRDSYVGPHSVLFGAGSILIGDKVALGPEVVVTSHGHTFADVGSPILDQPTIFEPVVIEDDVYVGAGSIILHGVTIGRGAVIGAGAVVSKDIPAGAVALGVPARVVRTRAPIVEEARSTA